MSSVSCEHYTPCWRSELNGRTVSEIGWFLSFLSFKHASQSGRIAHKLWFIRISIICDCARNAVKLRCLQCWWTGIELSAQQACLWWLPYFHHSCRDSGIIHWGRRLGGEDESTCSMRSFLLPATAVSAAILVTLSQR